MKLDPPQSLASIAKIIGYGFEGEKDLLISGLNEIHKVEPGDLVFVDHEKYYKKTLASDAAAILINKKVPCPRGKALIFSEDPFRDFNKLIRHFYPVDRTDHRSDAFVNELSEIGEGTLIQPGVFIGPFTRIGTNCLIYPHVTIYDHSYIGNNVIVHANTVIGADAFYFKKREQENDKLLTCGRVIIEDDVEIGALCTIDKGVTGDTLIGRGTKFDDRVHIGHDTVVGKNCLIAAQTGIGGAVTIGDNVVLWGQVGINKDVTIGEGAILLGGTGVTKSLEGGKTYFGTPAQEAREWLKQTATLRRFSKKHKD